MSITLPDNARGPILDLTLPASVDAIDIVLRNGTTGKQLAINLPAEWDGDDLSLDFFRRTIRDQTGADRSALLDASDNELWVPEPLIAGVNDVEIEALSPILSSTKSPSKVENVATGGTAWTNPSNAKASDNSYASVVFTEPNASQYLTATEYGFALPAGAIVAGIQPSIERSVTGEGTQIVDQSLRLLKAGAPDGDELGALTTWPGVDTVESYGGIEDLCGTTWTQAQINAANFGLRLRCASLLAGGTARVDHMPLTVNYRLAAAAYGAAATLRWEQGYH